MRRLALIALSLGLLRTPASADVARGDESARAWFVGPNLRTDLGTHRVRAGGGLRFGRLSLSLVVDPKVFVDTRQNDTDVLAEWWACPGGWAGFGGWRLTQVFIDRGRHFYESLIVGATAGMPALLDRQVRGRFGFELEANIVRHGAGIETDVISFESERHWKDLLSVSVFARFELAAAL